MTIKQAERIGGIQALKVWAVYIFVIYLVQLTFVVSFYDGLNERLLWVFGVESKWIYITGLIISVPVSYLFGRVAGRKIFQNHNCFFIGIVYSAAIASITALVISIPPFLNTGYKSSVVTNEIAIDTLLNPFRFNLFIGMFVSLCSGVWYGYGIRAKL